MLPSIAGASKVFGRGARGSLQRTFPLLVLATFLLVTSLATHAQRSAVAHKSVFVRHVAENQSCTASCQSKEAWITIPHAVGDLLKGGIGARQVHDTPIDGIPVFPRKSSWTGPDEADLAREFDQHVQANIVAYATAVTAWQAQYGLATATHDIVQRVTHRGREKRVIVNVLTFDNGNYYYNGARVMPEDPNAQAQILYVRAIPSTVTSGLSSTWNWPTPGTVSYELRGPTFASGAGFTTMNVGGTYDEPFDYSGTPFDPDAKLACLVDKTKPVCGQSQPDVKSLLGTSDATYAVLDYHRRIKPSGIRYGSGYAPQLTARVTNRVATFACPTEPNGTYSQVFRYSMKVENRIDRYLVFSDGRYYFIQSFKDVVTPAEVAISGSSAIARAGEYLNLPTRFLHHATGLFTDASAYAPNTVALEPVTTTNLAPYCGCAPQAPYTETRDCAELNSFWVGTYTRTHTYNAPLCSWSMTQDSSTCLTDWCTNLPGYQSDVPFGTVRTGTTCTCTGGRNWNSVSAACECPVGSSWNGSTCVVPVPVCSLTQSSVTTSAGTAFTLTWSSSNATSATLVQSVNGAPWSSAPCYPGSLNGSCQSSPATQGTLLYHFEATGPGGTATCEVTHTVTPVPIVDVCDNIAGNQTSPPPGTVQSGTSCVCTGGRSWNGSSCQCTPPTIWNGTTCVQPPPTCSLTQDTSTTAPGAPFNLAWGSTNATSATLTKSVNGGAFGLVACYPGTLNGTCQPTPIAEGSHLFEFDVSGPGGSVSCQVMHSVQAVDVCDNIAGTQSAPPPGTIQSGTSCICTGGRNWNGATGQCECPAGTSWNGAWCAPIDVCDNISGNQSSPPPGTFQSGNSCLCTGGRSWSDSSGQCECPAGSAWNGSYCAAIDVCDNIAGTQTSPPPDTYQSGSSCYCTGGRNWSAVTGRCECPSGTAWNGASCAVVTDECESINGMPDPTIQSSLPAGFWRNPGTRQCFSGDRYSEPGDNWALSCFGTASGYSSPVQPGPWDWGYDPWRLVLCTVAPTGGSADYCLAYTRKEDAYGQYWGITPVTPVVYPFGLVCLGNVSVTYFPGYVP